MNCMEIFLGESISQKPIDSNIFNALFNVSMGKSLYVITPKSPVPQQDETLTHVHNNYEFTIPLSHSPKLFIENKKITVPQGNIFPCNPGQVHGPAERTDSNILMAFQIESKYLQDVSNSLFTKSEIEFINNPVFCDYHIHRLLEIFVLESKTKQSGYKFIQENICSMISVHLLRILTNNINREELFPFYTFKQEIGRAVEFLHANYNNDFSVEEIAAVANLSKHHFSRVFKSETGKTPYKYLLDIKIEKAKQLIKTQKYPITEVCYMCGFKSHNHFSRLFLKITGITPSKYKELCKG